MLEISNLSKKFGQIQLFTNVSLEFCEGQVYSLVGGNGSGKSTLLNIISGFVKMDEGCIKVNGTEINNLSPEKRSKIGIKRTFQHLRLITQLSVVQNLLLCLDYRMFEYFLFSIASKKMVSKSYKTNLLKVENILNLLGLQEIRKQKVEQISFGQQKLLSIGFCLVNDPKILLLDEPVAGIDSINREKIVNLINNLKEKNKIIILVEHELSLIELLSENIIYFQNPELLNFHGFQSWHNYTLEREIE